jgi:prepilin-type N-terminal cleavage/methylation domain-containing protein
MNFRARKQFHRQAFTLIELLIVIAIIAVLAIVVVLTLSPGQLIQQ